MNWIYLLKKRSNGLKDELARRLIKRNSLIVMNSIRRSVHLNRNKQCVTYSGIDRTSKTLLVLIDGENIELK